MRMNVRERAANILYMAATMKWSKHEIARDANGARVPLWHHTATRFDACGAILRAAGNLGMGPVDSAVILALDTLRDSINSKRKIPSLRPSIAQWNDSPDQTESNVQETLARLAEKLRNHDTTTKRL